MIDIENLVITTIQTAYTTAGKAVTVTSDFLDAPNSLPCVNIYQMNNSTYERTLDTSLTEHHASVVFQVDVFSNKKSGAKSEVKELFNILDEAMQKMKFVRTEFNFIPNASTSVTRGSARYNGIVMEGKTNNTNTTYQMFRR